MACLIRKADSTDAPAISLIVEAALRKSNAQDYPPDVIEQVVQGFSPSQVLKLMSLRQVYVACIDTHVVATASLAGNTVRSVFVDPAYQRQGIGSLLMAAIESVAVKSGIERLRLPSSITAQGFYLSLGFVKVRDAFHGAERTIIMEKSLGQQA
ncbi:GNAT family N-acetyltransferase [Pseudomonas putida]|uniref:GNAT family N-acetyltransferase n=1 Tax=Pseudomonas putida TaxID=303 RepID=UPI00236438F7|nr:GNAT family N-acetyltransferase [Pseudomonas putida]MDD1964130.1 GNAT family N-acetyltransferase [Pseudomonas putida]